jgi:hypothetical protein
MKVGKRVHRAVSPKQATLLRTAIWEDETARIIDAEATRDRPKAQGNNTDIQTTTCGSRT